MTYRAIIAAAVSIGLLSVVSAAPARADIEYPWCGYISVFQGQQQSCTFSTLEQCRAFVTVSGYCDRNPRAMVSQPPYVPGRRR